MVFPGEHVSSLLRYRGQRRTKEMILPSPGWWSNEFTGVSDRSKGRDAYKNTRASQQILSPAWATTHKTASLETPRQAAKPAKSPTLPARSQQWPIAYVTYLGGEVIKHRDYRPLTHLQHGHDRELSGATPKAQVCHHECGLLKLGRDQVPYSKLCFHGNTQTAQTVPPGAACSLVLVWVVATSEPYSKKVS